MMRPGDTRDEFARCLGCGESCLNCVDVCPNRANVAVPLNGRYQVVHIDGRCNECGNCDNFCPYHSAPYRAKLTLFADEAALRQSENPGFTPIVDGLTWVRLDGEVRKLSPEDPALPAPVAALMRETLALDPWLAE